MQHSYVNMSKVMGNNPAFMRVYQVVRELKMQNQEKKRWDTSFCFLSFVDKRKLLKVLGNSHVHSFSMQMSSQTAAHPAGCVLVSRRQRILSDLRIGSSVAVCVCVRVRVCFIAV